MRYKEKKGCWPLLKVNKSEDHNSETSSLGGTPDYRTKEDSEAGYSTVVRTLPGT